MIYNEDEQHRAGRALQELEAIGIGLPGALSRMREETRPCPECDGTGHVPVDSDGQCFELCPRCRGKGWIPS